MSISGADPTTATTTRTAGDSVSLTATTTTGGTTASLAPDRVSLAATTRTVSLADAATVARTSGSLDVASMNPAQKLGAAMQRALPMMPADVRDKIAGMLTPENLAIMGGITTAWAASHAVGVGEVADLAMLGIGAVTMGPEVVGAAKDFAGFVGGALNAKSDADLDGAARHFSHFVSTVGVDGAAALLLHKAGSELGGPLDRAGAPGGTVEVQTAGGGRVRIPAGDLEPNRPLEMRGNEPSRIRQNLGDHEVAGGHTESMHVGKSDNWLRARLQSDPDIKAASTFSSDATANRTVGAFVKRYRAQIDAWVKSDTKTAFVETIALDRPVGRVLPRGEFNPRATVNATVMLVKDTSPNGWHVNTAYPVK